MRALDVMRKKRYLVLFLVAVLLAAYLINDYAKNLSPYQNINTIEGVWIEIDQDTVTPYSAMMTIHNETERADLFYGCWYRIEEKRWGRWYTLPGIEPGGPDIDLHIPTASQIAAGFVDGVDYFSNGKSFRRYPPNQWGYQWALEYGRLPPGDYRLMIEVTSDYDLPITEDSPRYYLAAEFSVEE